MRRMTSFSPVLLLLVLPVRLVWAQDSGDILTVTGFVFELFAGGVSRNL